MTTRRGRRTAWLFGLLGVALLGALLYVQRDPLVELWTLWQLDARDPEALKDSLERLGDVGSDRSVAPVADLLRGELADEAADALATIVPRAGEEAGAGGVRALLQRVRPGRVADALLEIGTRDLRFLPVFLAYLHPENAWNKVQSPAPPFSSWDPPQVELPLLVGRSAVFHVVVSGWQTAPDRVLDGLQGLSVARVLELCDPFFLARKAANGPGVGGGVPVPSVETFQAFAAALSRLHREPDVRIVALSLLVSATTGTEDDSTTTTAAEALLRAYSEDEHRRVKIAAVRIAGYAMRAPSLDDLFVRIFQECEDPELLREAIEARTLWVSSVDLSRALVLPGGQVCSWLPPATGTILLDERQTTRLEAILQETRDPALRDAASVALASVYCSPQASAPLPETRSDLEVHEWGVWEGRGRRVRPPEEELADLPPCVFRARATARDIERARMHLSVSGRPGPSGSARPGRQYPGVINVHKPVVFFYAERPVSALLEVGFRGGRPWTFFPDATDYLVRPARPTRARMRALGGSETEGDSPRPPRASSRFEAYLAGGLPPLESEPRQRPPWQVPASPDEESSLHPTELDRWQGPAPWLQSAAGSAGSQSGTAGRQAPVRLGEVALRWCGLRIGYDAELEMPPPEADGWWARIRKVPASTVAFAGTQEKFLFYDGVALLDSPVRLAWSDESRTELLVGVCGTELSREAADRTGAEPSSAVPGLLVVSQKGEGELVAWRVENLPAGERLRLPMASPGLKAADVRETFLQMLTGLELTLPEAQSLLDTWDEDLFEAPGLRAITFLPRSLYDRILPLKIRPVPGKLVRVGLLITGQEDIEVGAASTEWEGPCDWESPAWRRRPWDVRREEPIQRSREPLSMSPFPLIPDADGDLLVKGWVQHPRLSMDGRTLAYGLLEDYSIRVIIVDLERRAAQELLRRGGTGITSPFSISLSADGRRVAFTSPIGSGVGVYLADLGERSLTHLSAGYALALSPEGGYLAVQKSNSIEVVKVDSGEVWTVFDLDLESPMLSLSGPTICSQGRRIAFLAGLELDRNIYITDRQDSWLLDASRSEGRSWMPKLSASGRQIVFASWLDDGSSEVRLVDLDGRTVRRWSAAHTLETPPDITSDGREVLFRTGRGMCLGKAQSGDVTLLPGTESCVKACISGDGTRAVLVSRSGAQYHTIRVIDLVD